jgi:hypothetical protein
MTIVFIGSRGIGARIVICASLKNMDTKALQSLTIDAKQLDDDNHLVYQAKTCKTVIHNEELRRIRQGLNAIV